MFDVIEVKLRFAENQRNVWCGLIMNEVMILIKLGLIGFVKKFGEDPSTC